MRQSVYPGHRYWPHVLASVRCCNAANVVANCCCWRAIPKSGPHPSWDALKRVFGNIHRNNASHRCKREWYALNVISHGKNRKSSVNDSKNVPEKAVNGKLCVKERSRIKTKSILLPFKNPIETTIGKEPIFRYLMRGPGRMFSPTKPPMSSVCKQRLIGG